jgi:hypothetical protein
MGRITGLPKNRRGQQKAAEPEGLPGRKRGEPKKSAARDARICRQCGNPGRTVSNSSGVGVFCDQCKINWTISMVPMRKDIPTDIYGPRPLVKRTLVEPDYSLAFDDEEEPHGQDR